MTTLGEISCLIIDDDHFMLMTLSKLLESIGVVHIQKTDSAQEALKLLANRNNQFDVIITDLNMPAMDGIQLLRHLSGLGGEFGVILISGEDPRLLESVRNLGEQQKLSIIGSISKPVSRSTLETMLLSYHPRQQQTPEGPAAMVFANELQAAIANHQISIYLQPQIALEDNHLVGVEVLARWQHPTKGFIPPDIFIGIAEKYGMIRELTDLVFQQSIAEATKLHSLGYNITFSVNFSAQVLCSLELPEILGETLAATGLSPQQIIIEVTESSLADDMNIMLDILTRMRLKGFGLSIDDFGTGFSSLEQLHKIPFTELKIDKSFVHLATENQASRAILESSIALSKRLGIQCVAEGVENQEDWDLIQSLGCDIAQGYYQARPMPPQDFVQWARDYSLKLALSL